jgi:hypothetical protein
VRRNVLEDVVESVADAIVQACLGEGAMAVEVMIAEDIEPAFAFAPAAVGVYR